MWHRSTKNTHEHLEYAFIYDHGTAWALHKMEIPAHKPHSKSETGTVLIASTELLQARPGTQKMDIFLFCAQPKVYVAANQIKTFDAFEPRQLVRAQQGKLGFKFPIPYYHHHSY